MTTEIETALQPVTAAFDSLGVEYFLTGSVVTSRYGIARSTLDVDVVAALRREHVDALVAALEATHYIDRDAVLDAIKRRSMFKAIHLATMLKVDVYVLSSALDRAAMIRRRSGQITRDPSSPMFTMATAEDVIVNKLLWYRHGGEVSERQWSDVLGVLRVQQALDVDYMRRWARDLAIEDLLDRVLAEVAADPA